MSIPYLSPAEIERLAWLSGELGECQQAIGKILRHGYHSHHPQNGETNAEALEREVGDVIAAVTLMHRASDLDFRAVCAATHAKSHAVVQYLHHQPEDLVSFLISEGKAR